MPVFDKTISSVISISFKLPIASSTERKLVLPGGEVELVKGVLEDQFIAH